VKYSIDTVVLFFLSSVHLSSPRRSHPVRTHGVRIAIIWWEPFLGLGWSNLRKVTKELFSISRRRIPGLFTSDSPPHEFTKLLTLRVTWLKSDTDNGKLSTLWFLMPFCLVLGFSCPSKSAVQRQKSLEWRVESGELICREDTSKRRPNRKWLRFVFSSDVWGYFSEPRIRYLWKL